jgi:F-type H+-transporting ATPase subunit epsilon
MDQQASGRKLTVSVLSITGVLFAADDVDMMIVPGADGVMAVLPRHEPTVARLRPGKVEVVRGSERQAFPIADGYMEVHGNEAVVLVDEYAEEAYQGGLERALETEERAENARAAATDPGERERAMRDLDRARILLQIAGRHRPSARTKGRRPRGS